MKSGDIAALLVQGMQQSATGNTDVGYHTGVVTAWDDLTALNTVTINGNEFDNLRVITAGPAINIGVGDVVVVIRIKTQYFILGKVAAPGASAAIRSVSDFKTAAQTTSSVSFVDLGGPSVTTNVGSSGQVLVMISCMCQTFDAGVAGYMSFDIAGATTDVAQSFRAAIMCGLTGPMFASATNTVQVLNLNPGQTTFTAKYRSDTAGKNVQFGNRSLIVMPM